MVRGPDVESHHIIGGGIGRMCRGTGHFQIKLPHKFAYFFESCTWQNPVLFFMLILLMYSYPFNDYTDYIVNVYLVRFH